MKTIYRATTINYLNNEKVDYYTCHNWYYGELPKNEVYKEYSTFEEFYEKYGYENKTLFKREPYVDIHAIKEDAFFGKITKAKFESFKVVNEYSEVKGIVTMEDLMNRLSAEDFINYCKDHGLNVCPMK